MKLLIIPALLLATVAGPSAAVRFESDGVRVGTELVTGALMNLKESGASPLLVSGSVVESLSGETLAVSLGEKQVGLGAGLRLSRTADGYQLSTHGMAFMVESAGGTITADQSASFKVTPTGFDFGVLGALEGSSFAARVTTPAAPVVAAQDGQQPDNISPEKPTRHGKKKEIRRVYSMDPLAPGAAVSSVAIRQIPRVSPEGAP